MALAEGTSRVLVGPLTLHTRTAIDITSIITGVSANPFVNMSIQRQCSSLVIENILPRIFRLSKRNVLLFTRLGDIFRYILYLVRFCKRLHSLFWKNYIISNECNNYY